MSDTSATVVDDDDADIELPPVVAGFRGYFIGTAWKLDDYGKRVTVEVTCVLKGTVFGDEMRSGCIDYVSPLTGHSVNGYLPPPLAEEFASVLFQREWRMWDPET